MMRKQVGNDQFGLCRKKGQVNQVYNSNIIAFDARLELYSVQSQMGSTRTNLGPLNTLHSSRLLKKAKESFDLKHTTRSASKSKVKNMPFDDDQARALERTDLEEELKDIKNLLRLAFDKTRSTMPKIINGYIPYPGNDTLEEEANSSNEDILMKTKNEKK
uniref:Uncharacterized protein n=1 Tax=Romanomermis culicivorax TaxID=13658 RepID=A0A915JIJ0_ROMCU